jgi:hypothetical protein
MAKKMTLDEFLAMVKQVYDALPDSEAEKYGAKCQATAIGDDYHKTLTKYVSRQAILDAAAWVNDTYSEHAPSLTQFVPTGSRHAMGPYDLNNGGYTISNSMVAVNPELIFSSLMQKFIDMERVLAKQHKEFKVHSYGLTADTEYNYDDASSTLKLEIYYSTPANYAQALQQAQGKLYQVQSAWRVEAQKRIAAITVAERAAAQKAKDEEAAKKAEAKKKKEFDKMLKTIPKETLEALLAAKK